MPNSIVTLRLPRNQAALLQADLCRLAAVTRQEMTRPGLQQDRHRALASRAVVLEIIDDAVRSAMLEVPNTTRKSARGVESIAAVRAKPAQTVVRKRARPVPALVGPTAEPPPPVAKPRERSVPPALRVVPPTQVTGRGTLLTDQAGTSRILRHRSNAWLAAFIGDRREAG